MLFVDTLLYGLLAAWLDNIVPTEYGTRRRPWFCLKPSYWTSSVVDVLKQPLAPLSPSPDMEPGSSSLTSRGAVQIRKLRKVFNKRDCYGGSSRVVAVDDVSLDIYPGEITAILGHNGAGKTTLFNMLTGMTSVTSGQARIFGYNVR